MLFENVSCHEYYDRITPLVCRFILSEAPNSKSVFEFQKTAANAGSLNIVTSSAVHQPTACAKAGGSAAAVSGRSATAREALWGPVDVPNTPHRGCGALNSDCWLTGSGFGFLHCFGKSCTNPQPSVEQKMKISDLDYLLNGWRRKKRQLLCTDPNTAKTDFRETRTLPRVKAALHFIRISNVFWEVRRSFSERKMNCCSSRAVPSADAQGSESVKIDSRSLGKMLVTRQNGNRGKNTAFLKCNKEPMWSNYLKTASKPLKSMRVFIFP